MAIQHIIIAIMTTIFWAGNFVAAKYALHDFPALILLSLRFLFVYLMLRPFVKNVEVNNKEIFILSFFLSTLHFAGMFIAVGLGLDIASASIAGQLGVPFSCILCAILFNDKLGPWRSVGMAISFCGIVIVAGTPQIADNFIAFAIACISACAWGMANIKMKSFGNIKILPLLAQVSLFSIPQLAILSAIFEQDHLAYISDASLISWASVFYTALFSTIFAYGLWYKLLSLYPVSKVAPYSLLIPIFSIFFGQIFFDESFTTQMQIGAFITISGVAIITFRRPRISVHSFKISKKG